MPFTNYAILIPSNYGYSRSPREFRTGGHWKRKSFLTQALINLSTTWTLKKKKEKKIYINMYVYAQVIQNCTSLNRENNLYDWFHQKEQLSAL